MLYGILIGEMPHCLRTHQSHREIMDEHFALGCHSLSSLHGDDETVEWLQILLHDCKLRTKNYLGPWSRC